LHRPLYRGPGVRYVPELECAYFGQARAHNSLIRHALNGPETSQRVARNRRLILETNEIDHRSGEIAQRHEAPDLLPRGDSPRPANDQRHVQQWQIQAVSVDIQSMF